MICLACNREFVGRAGAKTCSPACRKRLSRGAANNMSHLADSVGAAVKVSHLCSKHGKQLMECFDYTVCLECIRDAMSQDGKWIWMPD